MNKLISYLFFFFAAIITPLSFAFTPEVVYRVDYRHPDVVFNSGFTSWGNNTELLPHIIGDTLRNRTDGLIGTTSNPRSAAQIAADVMPSDDDVAWLYEIVPNNNFYDVNSSLLNAAVTHNFTSAIATQSLNIYSRYSWQFEYVSRAAINSSQIIRAREIRWVNGQIEMHNTTVHENEHFVHTVPSVNSDYLVPTQSVDNLPVNFFGRYDDNPVGIYFGFDGCDNLLRKGPECKSVSYSVFTESVIKELNSKLLIVLKNY